MLPVAVKAVPGDVYRRRAADLCSEDLIFVQVAEGFLEPSHPLYDGAPQQHARRCEGRIPDKDLDQRRWLVDRFSGNADRMDEVPRLVLAKSRPAIPIFQWTVDHADSGVSL